MHAYIILVGLHTTCIFTPIILPSTCSSNFKFSRFTFTISSYTCNCFPFPHSSHTHVVADRGVCWEDACALAALAQGEGSGFYRSKREQYHRHLYLLALRKENSSHLFNIIR